MKNLLRNQKIRIDNHQRGSGSPNNWDDPTSDVHIEKFIKNNKDKYRIKIPINSNRPITVNKKDGLAVPKWLSKEIREVFEDDKQRRSFVKWICEALSAYNSNRLTPEQMVRQAVGYVGKAFGLPKPLAVFKNDIKGFYAELYYYDAHYYYVAMKRRFIYCALNEGIWKRFRISDNIVSYIYDKDVETIALE